MKVTTEASSFGDTDAAGVRIAYNGTEVKTAYTATVRLTWSPTGQPTKYVEVESAEADGRAHSRERPAPIPTSAEPSF